MGLLAIVVGQARKFQLFPRFVRALAWISLLCVFSGLVWLSILPMEGQFRNTYISENALLEHKAITFFRESEWNIVRGLKGQVREFWDLKTPEVERNAQLLDLFEQYGLKASTHDWEATNSTGQNLYAMQHASRGPHNEAIVIAAPWIGMRGEFNEGGVALLLALSRFFQRWNFWHKNVIFVLPSNSNVALRKWVDAYHANLQYTVGSIEGAVVLNYEFEDEFFDRVNVCFEGLNGQLPNLDLVNVAIHSVAAEFAEGQILGGKPDDTFQGRLETLTRHIVQQLTAGVGSDCGSAMFSGWRIDAITLDAIPGNPRYDITLLGRVCESTVRSINNLLEHFHQSFFFYLMLGPRYFVSIASYLPAAMLITNSFSVMALYKLAHYPDNVHASDWGNALLALVLNTLSASLLGHVVTSPAIIGMGLLVVFVSSSVFLSRNSVKVKELLHMIALALLGLELTTLAMINFSLAMVLGVVCVPLAWVKPQQESSLNRMLLNGMLLTLSCPLVLLLGIAHWPLEVPVLHLLGNLIRGYHDLGVSTWMAVMATWIPAWLISASCA